MDWKEIESRQNEAVKLAASLTEKKGRDQTGLFPAEGTTLLFDLIRAGIFPEAVYLARRAMSLADRVEKALGGASCRAYLLSDSAFGKVSTEKGSEGILSLFSKQKLEGAFKPLKTGRFVALENLQDPGNVGTVIRSAASFGLDGVFLCGSADPFSPKAIRASMGAIAHIPIRLFSSSAEMMDYLEMTGIHTVAAALSPEAHPIGKTNLSAPVCVLIGNEGKGLSHEVLSRAEEKSIIPIVGMESLNAAVAASVYLYEMTRREGA